MNKALFLDRDGVINYDYGYVVTTKRLKFRPQIFEICNTAKARGYLIVIITNQSGVGRGYFTYQEFEEFMSHILSTFASNSIKIDRYYYCPFHPDNGLGFFKKDSFDRKPNPGLILKALKQLNIDPESSIFIGDNKSDFIAAMQANIKLYINAKLEDWHINAIDAMSDN